ncbi:MAG TPA: IS1182 family transposase [Gammaproteobacteria bacterium]|nr:IS1182 family transposase [Gammaproteobacteria bacterium]
MMVSPKIQQEASADDATRSPRMRSPERSQAVDPMSIDKLIPEDQPARVVWELTHELDMTPLYDQINAVEGHPGRPPIDAQLLTGLWIYATSDGVSSARQLAGLCKEHDAYKWLCGGVSVNYHTLADFRTQHQSWLEEQVVTNIAVMRQEELIDLNQVGQDGMRVRASAGSDSFKREEKLEELLQEAQTQWDRLQEEFDNGSSEATARQRAARERAARQRVERLERAKEERKQVAAAREARKKGDGQHARASTTDPEARRMKMGDGGFRPAYNVQFATTLDTLVIASYDVINSGSDGGQMDPMVEQIEQQQGELPNEYYTDGGFSTKNDIENVGQRGVTVYTPIKEVEKKKKEGKNPFAPQKGDGPKVAKWRERMGTEEAQEKYKQRCKCEWPNAGCRNRGLHQFRVRGLEKVKSVVLWHILVHNLQRMVALRAQRAEAT